MNGEAMDEIRRIADAVLYEGYLLWPYRRSALKNQKRWTFGGVYPEPYSRARGADDPWVMRTECLVEGEADATVDVRIRFLHVVRREVARQGPGGLESVDELTVGDQRYLSWEEATEREVCVPAASLAALLDEPRVVDVDVPAGHETEWLADPVDPTGRRAGAVVRTWQPLHGSVEVRVAHHGNGVFTLTVTITNTTPWEGASREEALMRTLVSTHTVVHTEGGRLVSQTDPPPELRPLAEGCRNVGTWPVLVGEEGERHTILSAPIIMYDYPQLAPESPGDLFDATEIDQLLALNIRTLTDVEKQEMRDSDPRARQILDRTDALTSEQLMKLHGALREFRPVRER